MRLPSYKAISLLTDARRPLWQRALAAFALFFITTLLLYIPAARAGWVRDSIGWLGVIHKTPFWTYLNIGHHHDNSYYQLTQAVTWLLYRLFGTSRIAWLLVHVGLHAANAALLFSICRRFLSDAGLRRANAVALSGALLFCTSPYASEPVVWKAGFHFLQGLLLLLIILQLLLRYLHSAKSMGAWIAGAVFLLSLFSLEISYLTPFYCLAFILLYKAALDIDSQRIRKALYAFSLPQFGMMALHRAWIVFETKPPDSLDRTSYLQLPLSHYAIKPPLTVLHLLWGRFLPQAWRDAYHQLFCTYAAAGLFYTVIGALALWIMWRIRILSPAGKAAALLFLLLMLSMLIVLPNWFPERGLIYCDRYIYVLLPPASMLMAVGIAAIPVKWLGRMLAGIAIALNLCCTMYVVGLWRRSAAVIDALQLHMPAADTARTIILLNNPSSFSGAPMIAADGSQNFRTMHNFLYPGNIAQDMLEVSAYDMRSAADGAHVRVLNDTTLVVSLNQPGSWVVDFDTALSYDMPAYGMQLLNAQTYLLHLHGNPQRYSMWYQTGLRHKVVDMAQRDGDQR